VFILNTFFCLFCFVRLHLLGPILHSRLLGKNTVKSFLLFFAPFLAFYFLHLFDWFLGFSSWVFDFTLDILWVFDFLGFASWVFDSRVCIDHLEIWAWVYAFSSALYTKSLCLLSLLFFPLLSVGYQNSNCGCLASWNFTFLVIGWVLSGRNTYRVQSVSSRQTLRYMFLKLIQFLVLILVKLNLESGFTWKCSVLIKLYTFLVGSRFCLWSCHWRWWIMKSLYSLVDV